MDLNKISRILNNNKNNIERAKEMMDSAVALSLLGASIDRQARSYITSGLVTIIGSGIILSGVAITGIAGPVVAGVAIAPTLAKTGILAGISSTIAGFIKGFRSGVEQSRTTANAIQNVKSLLERHSDIISNENIKDLLTAVGVSVRCEL